MAARYPNEYRPEVALTLAGFLKQVKAAEENGGEGCDHMTSFVLTGRLAETDEEGNEVEFRTVIKKPRSFPNPASPEDVQRSFHRRMGKTDGLPFACDLMVYPLGMRPNRMKNHFDMIVHIDQGERGKYDKVPVHKIPHVFFGENNEKGLSTYLVFPELYYTGCLTVLFEADNAVLYEKCVFPALEESGLEGGVPAGWKPVFSELYAYPTRWWELVKSAGVELNSAVVEDFGREVLQKAHEQLLFRDAFFIHEIDDKQMSHDPENEDDRTRDWENCLDILSVNGQLHLNDWVVEVVVQFTHIGKVVLWQEDGIYTFLLATCDSSLPEATVKRIYDRAKKGRSCGATEWSPEKVSVQFGPVAKVRRVTFITNDSQEMRDVPGWRMYTTRDMMPEFIEDMIDDLDNLCTELSVAAREASLHTKPGVATITAQIDMSMAKDHLVNYPEASNCLSIVDARTWWGLKRARVAAIRHAVQITSRTPHTIRMDYKSCLAFTPVLIHILNCITCPQPLTAELRLLLNGSAFFHVPDAQSPEAMAVGLAAGRGQPALSARGLYFIAGIAEQDIQGGRKTWRIAGLERPSQQHLVTTAALVALFDCTSYSALKQMLGLGSSQTVQIRQTDTGFGRLSRSSRTMLVAYLQKRPTTMPIAFNLEGIQLVPKVPLTGLDIFFAGSAHRNEDDLIDPENMDNTLNNFILQASSDIIAKMPNRRAIGSKPYCTLSALECEAVPKETYLQAILPSDCAHIVLPTATQWNMILTRLFPPKGHVPKRKMRNLPYCTYYQSWAELLNRLHEDDADLVVQAIHAELNNWYWLPSADTEAMWVSKSGQESDKAVTLPEDHAGPAPFFSANPHIFRSMAELNRFILR